MSDAPAETELRSALAQRLLAETTSAAQQALLDAADLLNQAGLMAILDQASELVRGDPVRGQALAQICAEIGESCDIPAIVPRATYLRAQAHAANGELDIAIALIEAARSGYIALGQQLDALRTNIGLMSVLIDVGRYSEALAVGAATISAASEPTVAREQPETILRLAASVQQNRGVCYEQIGRYDEALEAYTAAETHFTALGLTEHVGEILNNRAIVLANLGRGGEALTVLDSAYAIFAEAGLALLQAQTVVNIGESQLLLSNYSEALEAFKRAQQLFTTLDVEVEQQVLLRYTADAYAALNLYPEALASYRESEQRLLIAGLSHDRARALWGMGTALAAQGQRDAAGQALRDAAALFEAADNLPLLSGVRLEHATLLAAQGEHAAAIAMAQSALDLLAGHDWPIQHCYAHLRIADLLMHDTEQAERHLVAAQRFSDALALPHLRYRLHQRLGRLRLAQGRSAEALVLLEAAVETIEQLRGNLANETMRASFSYDKVAAFEDLVQLFLERGGPGDLRRAFTVAERAKARALVDLLTGVIRAAPAAGQGTTFARRIQVLQADLNVTYNELLSSASQRAESHLEALHRRAADLEQQISRLRLAHAEHATIELTVSTPALDTLLQRLPRREILIAYTTIGAEIIALVCTAREIRAVRAVSSVSTIQQMTQRLTAQWDRFRVSSHFADQHMPRLIQSTQRTLAQLYTELIAPLADTIEALGQDCPPGVLPKLTLIPQGILHQVPFHALYDGQRYLLERYEIGYAPSATVLALCRQRAARTGGVALVLGVSDASIPAVATELASVAQHLAGAVVYADDAATIAVVREHAASCRVLHMACHGLFRADNPMFSALKLGDGWLTAADVLSLDLEGSMVALSACESGRTQIFGGDEVLGLMRAFLGAGASALVVSLWLAQDTATAELMAAWYAQIEQRQHPGAALRLAQLAIKERYPHPYYWAPFILVGGQ